MLELIFQGFIEWTYGLILECWEYFSSMLLNVMSMDFAYLKERMPVIQPVMQTMLALGWALLIGNLVFQAVRSMMTGLGFEAEDPKLLFGRTFVFSFLLVASPQICNIALNMTSTVINMLEVPDAVDIKFADKASFAGLSASWLLVVICGVSDVWLHVFAHDPERDVRQNAFVGTLVLPQRCGRAALDGAGADGGESSEESRRYRCADRAEPGHDRRLPGQIPRCALIYGDALHRGEYPAQRGTRQHAEQPQESEHACQRAAYYAQRTDPTKI